MSVAEFGSDREIYAVRAAETSADSRTELRRSCGSNGRQYEFSGANSSRRVSEAQFVFSLPCEGGRRVRESRGLHASGFRIARIVLARLPDAVSAAI